MLSLVEEAHMSSQPEKRGADLTAGFPQQGRKAVWQFEVS